MITSDVAVAAGVIEAKAVARAKQQMTEPEFDAAYRCIPYEALFNPFGGEAAIRERIMPLTMKEPVAWGIDPARAADMAADNSVAIGLDENGNVCDVVQLGRQELHLQRNDAVRLIGNKAFACIERNGLGRAMADELELTGNGRIESFNSTNMSKRDLVHDLVWAIGNNRIHFPDGIIVEELIDYERRETATGLITYGHPPNKHDDHVDALMLAWRAYNKRKPSFANWTGKISF